MDAIDEEQTRIGCHGRIPAERSRSSGQVTGRYARNLTEEPQKTSSESNIGTEPRTFTCLYRRATSYKFSSTDLQTSRF